MANLLYVTSDVLTKLKTHPAYRFWNAFVQNTPIRIVPLEERSFHPRSLTVEENHIYLTIDMKFAYCRDKMLSFMYETQDLSFRLQAIDGILRTLDNKQFTALIGKIAKVTSTSDIELVNAELVYHPFFDTGKAGASALGEPPEKAKSTPVKAKAKREASAPKKATNVQPTNVQPTTDGLVLGRYDRELCEKLFAFRMSSKKSYSYLGKRFNLKSEQVKEICHYYNKMSQDDANSDMARDGVQTVPLNVQERIVRMKSVSKKSYTFLADQFNLPVQTVQDICAVGRQGHSGN